MVDKKLIIESLYNWKVFLAVIILFFLIEIFTTPIGGGYSGFPLNTCTHGSIISFKAECNWINILLNLLGYYIISVLIFIIIKKNK